jgi:hypothetical protein
VGTEAGDSMSTLAEVELLLEPLKHTDPRLWQALHALSDQLELLIIDIEPLVRQSQLPSGGIADVPPPTALLINSAGNTLRFDWGHVVGAVQYEVRKGDNWDTAFFQFRTVNLSANIDPILVGTHTYLIKSMNAASAYSITATAGSIQVNGPAVPVVSSSVIDNNVLLSWVPPASFFNIRHYIIKKAGVQTGLATGTFISFFETLSGTYNYSVSAVDVAGNVGAEASISVQVNQPPDFALQDRRVSALLGTKVNVWLEPGPRLFCSWAAENWQNHFVGRSWDQPSDQTAAGYPIYIQPAAINGSYEEVIDYGTTINNLIVNVTYGVTQITSSVVNIVVKMATSLDGSSYSSFTTGASQFFSSFRYLKFRIEFTGSDDKALIYFYNLTISIDVKRENDGGEVNALATDVNGTLVYFTKPFKDIESITTTTKSTTEPFYAIFIFTDVPNPTSFRVMAFDSSGNRVTRLVDWKVRGIV